MVKRNLLRYSKLIVFIVFNAGIAKIILQNVRTTNPYSKPNASLIFKRTVWNKILLLRNIEAFLSSFV